MSGKAIDSPEILAPSVLGLLSQPRRAADTNGRDQRGTRIPGSATHTQQLIRLLLVADSPDAASYVQELKRAQFVVFSQLARNTQELTALLSSQCHDVVVCDDGLRDWTGGQALELVRQHDPDIPFIVVTRTTDDDVVAEFMLNGATDCVDKQRLDLLPLAVGLAVKERTLREERNRAEQELERSQALYRALSENPTHGICRFDVDGRLRDVNETLVAMLGYASRDELLAVSLWTAVMRDPAERAQLLECCHRTDRVDGIEVEWTRKDGTLITVRLGGRQVRDETTSLNDWELIAEDITAQRALEHHLRSLAATDPLTGLANYRRLVESLDEEIRRSARTGRSFAVLLCDLDGMKLINDRYGHVAGNRALCRLADTFRRSCRSIDTPARYGGDEFAIVLAEVGSSEASVVKRRICEHLVRDHEQPSLSISMGVAVYPRDGDTMEQLLLAADHELYQMKDSHRHTGWLSTERKGLLEDSRWPNQRDEEQTTWSPSASPSRPLNQPSVAVAERDIARRAFEVFSERDDQDVDECWWRAERGLRNTASAKLA